LRRRGPFVAFALVPAVVLIGFVFALAWSQSLEDVCFTNEAHPVRENDLAQSHDWSWRELGVVCEITRSDGRVERWVER
jgi:hypothetical protein